MLHGPKQAHVMLPTQEKQDLEFANIVCKHLKSNAIALVKNKQLIGKGCGQTSRIDALRQAVDKAKQSGFSLQGAVMASDAFFPFNDCVQMAMKPASQPSYSREALCATMIPSHIARSMIWRW